MHMQQQLPGCGALLAKPSDLLLSPTASNSPNRS